MYAILLCCTIVVSTCYGVNPGLKTRLSKTGLDYANKVAIDILTADLQGSTVSDQHGSDKIAGIHVDYDVTNMRITSFSKPAATITINPGRGATWAMSGGSCALHGDWHYKARKAFIKWSDSGHFDVKVSNMRFSLSVTMGRDSSGHPSISASSCSADTGTVDVKFHGGASWLYNLFRSNIESSLKKQLNNILCSQATQAINGKAEQALAHLDVVTSLGSDLSLNYQLTDKPTFSTDAIETTHLGEIFFTSKPKSPPFSAPPISASAKTRMMTVWLSDYIANSAGYASHTNGLLQYNLTAKDLAVNDSFVLNTTCGIGKNCFGTFIPMLNKLYPNHQVELDMYTTAAPKAVIKPGKINLTFSGNLEVRLATKNGNRPFLFSANATMTTNVRAAIKNNILVGTLQNTSVTMKIMKASITNNTRVLQMVLNFAMRYVTDDFIDKQLNAIGAKGIPIPVLDGVRFVNSKLTLIQDAIQLETDVEYKPTSINDLDTSTNLKFKKQYRSENDVLKYSHNIF